MPSERERKRLDRVSLLKSLLAEKILVFDGAMGTSIQGLGLEADDFGGETYEGCNEVLNLLHPEKILEIHRSFLRAGADILETNTFGSTPLVLGEYGLAERAREISRAGAAIARRAADEMSTLDKPRFVAGSMGPTTKALSVTGGCTFDEMVSHYREQALGLIEGGVDFLLLETAQDTLNVKAGMRAVDQAGKRLGRRVPLSVSCTIERTGTMLGGQGVEAFYTSVEHADLLSVGMNCATGPAFMTDFVRSLSSMARCAVSVVPNAGLPDETGRYLETPETMASVLGRFARRGWVNLVGGCCGTTPDHIRAIAATVEGMPPRRPVTERVSAVSGIEFLSLEEENRPVIVGERTNVIGSRRFQRLIREEKYEEAAEVGKRQVKGGAHLLDVCLADPDRDEARDMTRFLARLTRKVKVPIMLDSTNPEVLSHALRLCPGKCIINSVNLEDGEERFGKVVPLAKEFGAALVVGCIDEDPEQGMAVTRERKLKVAQRAWELLTGKYGVPEEDLIFDPLVFPCATGDAAYRGSAQETIEGLRLIKKAFPRSKTILGVSNVSFGLPVAAREVLNSVFLHHCVEAGLDLAIVNSERLERYASIPEPERTAAENLLYERGEDPAGTFAALYRDRPPARGREERKRAPLEERLAAYVVEGTRDGLAEDLDLALASRSPIEIINGPLMKGMVEVGRLFRRNELIVAEVLQSAEVMKAAVARLEPHMEKTESQSRGKLLLATVKGDVHDIGKNLVEIVIANNGFEVVDLGIKVPPQKLIEGIRVHQPDFVGLSGLLVKSAGQMVVTAQDLREAGLSIPILVGGAALTRKFVSTRIAPEYEGPVIYCRNAMDGLDVVTRLMDASRRDDLLAERASATASGETTRVSIPSPPSSAPRWQPVPVPTCPDFDLHVVNDLDLRDVFAYVNPQMLYAKHLGLRGSVERLRNEGDPKAAKLERAVEELKEEARRKGLLEPRGLYRFFGVRSEGDDVILADRPGGKDLARFHFPRQSDRERLCLSDWVAPSSAETRDSLAAFVVTAGHRVREQAEIWKAEGEYLKSYALQALALETAEAAAELIHRRLRALWGFPDSPEMTQRELFQARYRGIRVSFGYPACPNLEDQAVLWRILEPDKHIGVKLTEGFMMEPEASISALVFHHPAAKYFAVGEVRPSDS